MEKAQSLLSKGGGGKRGRGGRRQEKKRNSNGNPMPICKGKEIGPPDAGKRLVIEEKERKKRSMRRFIGHEHQKKPLETVGQKGKKRR